MGFDERDIILCATPDVMNEPWKKDDTPSSFSTEAHLVSLLKWIILIDLIPE